MTRATKLASAYLVLSIVLVAVSWRHCDAADERARDARQEANASHAARQAAQRRESEALEDAAGARDMAETLRAALEIYGGDFIPEEATRDE